MDQPTAPDTERRRLLRVLLIEDSEDDALLLLRALRHGGYETTSHRVDTSADLDAALDGEPWDIVFCDYVMPRLSGPDAIAIIRGRQPDLPVIMVSGEVGEEYAVAAMKAGANDFVLKGRLSRLVPAVDRELQEAKRRAAHRAADALLRDTQERYQLLVEQLPLGIVVVDGAGQVVAANPSALTLLGSPSEEATRQFNVLSLPNLQRSGISDAYARVLRDGTPQRIEDWYTSVWGKRLLLRFEVAPLRDAQGAVRGAITIIEDMTERTKAEAARDQSEAQLRELVDSVDGVVWEADATTFAFTFVSSQAETLLGVPPERWISEPTFWFDHVHPEDRERAAALCRDATDRLQNHTFEFRMCRADGRTVWVRDIVTVIAEAGRPVRLRGIMLDITAQRAATAALRNSEHELHSLNRDLEQRVTERTAQLEAANRELDAFGYSVSHDLIAPLRAVDGYVHMVLEDDAAALSDGSRSRLERVQAVAGRMGSLIDRLLEMSRVTRAEVNRGRVDLSALAESIAADLRLGEPERQVEFSIAAGVAADADLPLARVVLENLLRNAWKYTRRRPTAHVRFETVAGQDPPVYVVRDDGVGFDMADAERLFIAFQRLHAPGDFDGSGIGLATTLRIIQRHGGKIWAEAAPDRGAAFFFTLQADA